MHESSLARQLVNIAVERAAGARRILRVDGWIAETESLSPASLELHFAASAKGTPAEGAKLILEMEHVKATCHDCSETYAPEAHMLVCPHCGGTEATLLGRTGFGIRSLEVDP